MAVVPIDAPRAEDTFHVAIVPRPPDVIHHLVAPIFDNGDADFGGEGVQHLVPGGALPLAFAALPGTLQGIENASGVVDLVDGGRSLGAVTPATARMIG